MTKAYEIYFLVLSIFTGIIAITSTETVEFYFWLGVSIFCMAINCILETIRKNE